jgi:hypothetical protein
MSAELVMVNEAMAEAISCEPAPIASFLPGGRNFRVVP